jgi:ribonucleoside-diphosphate reductase alpha chain
MTFDLERRDQEDGLTTQNPLAESRQAGFQNGTPSGILDLRPTFSRTVRRPAGGLKVKRRFTAPTGTVLDPYDTLEWERRTTRITNPDGTVVFEMKDIEIPRSWSQVAGDILTSKYLRKAGIPLRDAAGNPVLDEKGEPRTTGERSARQVIGRLVGCWRHWGEEHGYFATGADAAAFEAELAYMLLHQVAAPNSPQWFNTGLHQAYGLTGPSQGHYYVDPHTEELKVSSDAYTRPQPHACFIQAVRDDLVNKGGIMDLWVREARLFKYGSGTGTNFSSIRAEGEPLGGGGFSSGLMSFLKIGDRAAGAIKSGGTTRRAAKMVCLDLDHPDIELFINWKAEEERKVAALIAAGYSRDFNGDAYATISGQNSNNSVRASNDFMRAVVDDGDWKLRWRTDGRITKTLKARELWSQICKASWRCADPGVQLDTTINEWHTCPKSGRINASNPCSEYMFLDDTACNLASINLVKFYDPRKRAFDIEGFRHAVKLWTYVLEISVLMAQYPSGEIAQKSYDFRTLGLGYANLGTLLMLAGIPYDSDAGRTVCGAITAVMTGESYAASAEMARELGPFSSFEKNREDMMRVMRNHRRAAFGAPAEEYEGLSVKPMAIDSRACPPEFFSLIVAAREAWDQAVELGTRHGYRNAQTTVLAPTGTIGLLMDCDTTGVEPDFALVKFKKLAGGGYFKILNRSVASALEALGYSTTQVREIMEYVEGTNSLTPAAGSLAGAPGSCVNREQLLARGLGEEQMRKVEEALPRVLDLAAAFNAAGLRSDCLASLGFSREDIAHANDRICGRHTVEGAPHLLPEHLAVFDCANRCGRYGKRFIHYLGHIRMMAAAQPFITGAISKTINLPSEATVDDIHRAYFESWQLGLKAIALYRDGCKQSQPLSTETEKSEKSEKPAKSEKQAKLENAEKPRAPEAKAAAAAPASPSPGAAEKEPAPVAPASVSPASVSQATVPPAPVASAAASTSPAPAPAAGKPARRPLPAKRFGYTQEAKIGGHKLYLRTGQYEDGTLGEIFIDMHKEGAAFRSIMNCFAIAVSKGLQYGVPLKEFVDTFTFTRFAPHGLVEGHANLKMSTSILDYIFRALAIEYLGEIELAHVKPPALGDGDPGEQALLHGVLPGVLPGGGKEETGGSPAMSSSAALHGALPEVFPDQDSARTGGGDPFFRALSDLNGGMMGDAPICEKCGHITVRNGSCYRCMNCGHSMGCS